MLSAATISLIIAGFQLAIKEAPAVAALAVKFKEYITALFQAGVITIDQQKKVHDYVDSVTALAEIGIAPSHWQVEPDPAN